MKGRRNGASVRRRGFGNHGGGRSRRDRYNSGPSEPMTVRRAGPGATVIPLSQAHAA
jgi:hypothetical protein